MIVGAAASLYGTLQANIPAYTTLLEQAGYFVGFAIKGWGPGTPADGGYSKNPAGKQFPDFEAFLAARPKDKPFCFWYGTHDPHVPWDRNTAARERIAPSSITVPPHLPDAPETRNDIRSYYAEVEQFDLEAGAILNRLSREYSRITRTFLDVRKELPSPVAPSVPDQKSDEDQPAEPASEQMPVENEAEPAAAQAHFFLQPILFKTDEITANTTAESKPLARAA